MSVAYNYYKDSNKYIYKNFSEKKIFIYFNKIIFEFLAINSNNNSNYQLKFINFKIMLKSNK